MKACAAPFCKRSPNQNGALFYPFPEDKSTRALWIEKLHLKYVASDASLKICSRHFKPSDFILVDGVKSLSPKSYPSQFITKRQYSSRGEDTESEDEAPEPVTSTATVQPEETPPRRKPCRRAAMLAAEKINNAVNVGPGYYVDDDDDDYDEVKPRHTTKRSKVDEDYDYAAETSFWRHPARRTNRYIPPFPNMPNITITPITSRSTVATIATSTTTITKPFNIITKRVTPQSHNFIRLQRDQKASPIESSKNIRVIWSKDLRTSQKASPSLSSPSSSKVSSHSTQNNNHGIILECCEELLSSVQLNSQLNARKKYASALETIAKFKTLNAKVIDEDDTLVHSPPPSSPPPSPSDKEDSTPDLPSTQENGDIMDPNPPPSPILPPTREKQTFEPLIAAPAPPPLYRIVKDEKTGVILAAHLNSSFSDDATDTIPKKEESDSSSTIYINGDSYEEEGNDYPLVFEMKGGAKPPFADSLMSLKISPLKQEPNAERELEALKNWLEEESAFVKPVQWMMKHGLMAGQAECRVCKCQMFLESDPSAPDGFVWQCLFPKCMLTVPVIRPGFFSWFGIPLGKLIEICYQWALQADPSDILTTSELDLYIIRKVWKGLQDLCGRTLASKPVILGSSLSNVEVAVAGLGSQLAILCAFDRKSGQARFTPLLKSNLKASVPLVSKHIVDPLATVISADSLAESWKKCGFYQQQASSFAAGQIEGRRDRNLLTIQGAKEALQNLAPLFENFSSSQLTLHVVQGILNEYQWRERFGRTNLEAFWNILIDIGEQSGHQADLGSHLLNLPEVSEVPSISNSSTEISDQSEDEEAVKTRKGKKLGRLPDWIKKRSTDYKYPLDPMPLDEFYYSKMMPSKFSPWDDKFAHTFQCYECKEELPNNIKVMSHIRSHLEHQLNPHLLDMLHCRCCYRPFPSPYSMHCHMEKHLDQDGVYPCRICMVVFSTTSELLQHMSSMHHKHEMPYSCKICNFRSSFHKDIIEHFVELHGESNHVLCQFCLKVYSIKVATSLPGIGLGLTRHYHQHMVQHTHSANSRKCSRCTLVFVGEHLLQAHRKIDHHFIPPDEDAPNLKPYTSSNPNRTIILPKKPEKPPKETSKSKNTCSHAKYLASIKNQRCLECNNNVDENHFSKALQCEHCTFSSFCYGGFLDHLRLHEPSSSRKFVAPVQVSPDMYCSCGYATDRGNQIADHLVHCNKTSCHSALPTPQQIYEVDDIEVFAFYQQELLQQEEGVKQDVEVEDKAATPHEASSSLTPPLEQHSEVAGTFGEENTGLSKEDDITVNSAAIDTPSSTQS